MNWTRSIPRRRSVLIGWPVDKIRDDGGCSLPFEQVREGLPSIAPPISLPRPRI